MWDPVTVLEPALNHCFHQGGSDPDLAPALAAAPEHPRGGVEGKSHPASLPPRQSTHATPNPGSRQGAAHRAELPREQRTVTRSILPPRNSMASGSLGIEVSEKQVALVAPHLPQAKPTKTIGQSKQWGHIWSTRERSGQPCADTSPSQPWDRGHLGSCRDPSHRDTSPESYTGHKSCRAPGLGKQWGGETFLRQGKQRFLIKE